MCSVCACVHIYIYIVHPPTRILLSRSLSTNADMPSSVMSNSRPFCSLNTFTVMPSTAMSNPRPFFYPGGPRTFSPSAL